MNYNSSGSANGWDGQICQSIYYAFRYLKELKSINVEYNEDIELFLKDEIYLIQSKISQEPYKIKSSNNKYFIEGINSLSIKEKSCHTRLLYSTNIYNPDGTKPFIMNNNSVDFSNLPNNVKNKIRTKSNLSSYDKFSIRHIPFDGNNDNDRIREILIEIRGILEETVSNKAIFFSKKLFNLWHRKMFYLASKKDDKIGYIKDDFILSIIRQILEGDIDEDNVDSLTDLIDCDCSSDDIINTVQNEFDRLCEDITSDYSVFINVIKRFRDFEKLNKHIYGRREMIFHFVNDYHIEFINEYMKGIVDDDITKMSACIFILRIVNKRTQIKKVRGVLD